jgi:hypothetical protein
VPARFLAKCFDRPNDMNKPRELELDKLYGPLKAQAIALRRELGQPRLKYERVLDAMTQVCGFAAFIALSDALSAKAPGDANEPETRPFVYAEMARDPNLRLLWLLSSDLASASSVVNADWLRLETALRGVARKLSLGEDSVFNAAARAWCRASDWRQVQERVLERRLHA